MAQEELRSYVPTFGEKLKYGLQDLLMGLGMNTANSQHISGGVRDLLGFTPVGIPMAVSDMGRAMDQGDLLGMAAAGLGAMPGVGPTARVAKKATPSVDVLAKELDSILAAGPAVGAGKAGMPSPENFMRELEALIASGKKPKLPLEEAPPVGPATSIATGAPVQGVPLEDFTQTPYGVTLKQYTVGKETKYEVIDDIYGLGSIHDGFDSKADATKWFNDYGYDWLESYAAKPPKPAPIDTGISLEKWLEKNPGGSFGEFMGQPTVVPKPPPSAGPAPASWEMPSMGTERYVPPAPPEVHSMPPNWMDALADPEEAVRQANRIAGGYTTDAYHGTTLLSAKGGYNAEGRYIPANSTSTMAIDPDFYSTSNPQLAEMYASGLTVDPRKGYAARDSAQIAPLKLNTQDYHVVDAEGKAWTQVNRGAIAEARARNAPGVAIHNVWDEPASTSINKGVMSPQTVFITLPGGEHTVRSAAAKFDPKKFSINDLLAGLAGAGVIGGGLSGNYNE